MKKKLLSLVLTLAMSLSLSVPALADRFFWISSPDGIEETTSLREVANRGWLSIDGVTQTGTIDREKQLQLFDNHYLSVEKVSVYDADGPVKIQLWYGKSESGNEFYKDGEVFRNEFGISLVQYDSTTKIYKETKADPVYFEGRIATYPTGNTREPKIISIQEWKNQPNPDPEEEVDLMSGAEVTLSDPGTYLFYMGTPYFSFGAIFNISGSTAQPAPATPTTAAGFSDVPASSPFAEAIKWAVDKKITNGKTATTFGPGDTCTVSHILTFLYRAAGSPNKTSNERNSVTAWAKGLGINPGNLDVPCTRAMAVNFMWKAAGSPAPSKTTSFADVSASADYAKAVSWAVEKGITNGTGGDAFSPGGTCTRGQIVTFLFRAGK